MTVSGREKGKCHENLKTTVLNNWYSNNACVSDCQCKISWIICRHCRPVRCRGRFIFY